MVILGLDSSTSVTGWAFSKDGKVLDAGYIDTKKFETTKEKTFVVISELEKNPLIKTNTFRTIVTRLPLIVLCV